MIAIAVLLGLVVLAIPVLIIVLLVGQSTLKHRVSDLETRLKRLDRSGDAEPDTRPQASPVADRGDVIRAAPPEADAAQPRGTTPTGKPGTPPPDIPDFPSDEPTPRDLGQSEPVSANATHDSPPGAFVFRRDRFDALANWLRENWFYAVSAVSLALAGIFLVQYGVENGLLPPRARVIAALMFGAILIAAGEFIRRRFGDDPDRATAYLPSVFSGAGLVTLFGAVLAARLLYDLIGAEAALGGMIAVALAGLALGWYHGPVLAAVALTGAFAAPFVVGGSSDDPSWLFGYFAIVTLLGLGIDTIRRWAWISVLSLSGGFATGWLLHAGDSGITPAFMVYVTVLAVAAIVIPGRRWVPDHAGPMVSAVLWRQTAGPWPEFPVRLAFGAGLVSSALLATVWSDGSAEFWLGVVLMAGLALALMTWAARAEALQDIALFPAVGLLGFVFVHGTQYNDVYRLFAETYAENAEADYPLAVTLLVALAALMSVTAAWRSFGQTAWPAVWAGAAALYAPAMAILLDLSWFPYEVIGAYPWALHATALAVLMVAMAERFARVDGDDRLRTSLAVLSALSCLAFAFVIIFSKAALTVALAVTVVAAAALDRRFKLFPMTWYIAAGVVTLGFRLIVDPGLDWARYAPLAEMLLAYGGTLAAFVAALWLVRPLDRPLSRLMLDSAAWSTAGVFLSLLLFRWLDGLADPRAPEGHWSMGLNAVIWLSLAFAQLRRVSAGGALHLVRQAMAGIFGALGAVALLAALTMSNPVAVLHASPVLGPPVLNTLVVAYLLPAGVIALAIWRLDTLPQLLRRVCQSGAIGLAAVWLGLAIRHFWQGAEGMHQSNGVTQPELYTYTIALLIIGAGLFYQSLARHSHVMRRAGLVVIGLAVAKVFLIDISGLGGLIRVFSLLVLGLALAGLAWLNRWAQIRQQPEALDQ